MWAENPRSAIALASNLPVDHRRLSCLWTVSLRVSTFFTHLIPSVAHYSSVHPMEVVLSDPRAVLATAE